MFNKIFATALVAIGLAGSAHAASITPDIIWGSGNTNQGFTVETTGGLELGLRAKRRHPANDTIGDGIVQDTDGNYLFDSSESTAGSGQAMWSFDWSINTDVDGTLGRYLDAFTFRVDFDEDASEATSFSITYDPMGLGGTGYYLGTNANGNGGAAFTSVFDIFNGNPGPLSTSNVAQNSVQPQWVGGATGSGQFNVRLSAFLEGELFASTEISAIVDAPATVPLPAALPLLICGVGAIGAVASRRKRKQAA